MSATITINISGPGGSVNYDAEVIRMALAMVGYKFEVENNYPIEQQLKTQNYETAEEYIEMVQAGNPDMEMPTIKMNVYNAPWGG